MQKYKKCILSLKKAIQLDKHNAHAYYVQGLVFKQIGDTGKAIDSWRTATDYNADHFDSYLQLGITQYERGNPIAEHYLANAFALDPKNIELLYAMGMFYQNYGYPDKAIDTYYSILSLNINQPKVHYNLGYIHISVKEDYTTGHEHFANAIKSDSTYADAYYMRGLCEENLGKYRNARLDYQQCLELATNHDLAILGLNRLDDAKR
jgi:Tfp pilus assembly protein PilF